MTQFPSQSEPAEPLTVPYAGQFARLPGVSGFAIASLVCGTVGMFTCCLIVPSVLGVVFGAVALPSISSGKERGKGLAVSGIILGVVGLLMGIAVIAFSQLAPDSNVIPGRDLSKFDRATLRTISGLGADEKIELYYATGFWSIKEGGVLLTDRRLLTYEEDGFVEEAELVNIAAIEFTAAQSWIDDSWYSIETDDGEVIYFMIGGQADGNKEFERALRRGVKQLRETAGKPAPQKTLTIDVEDTLGDE